MIVVVGIGGRGSGEYWWVSKVVVEVGKGGDGRAKGAR